MLSLKEEAERLVSGAWARYQAHVQVVAEHFGSFVYRTFGYSAAYLQSEDKQRLLVLYHKMAGMGLDFEEGIRVLMEYWAKHSRQPVTGRLPVRIWNLTGPLSMQLLTEYVKRSYPGEELWWLRLQEAEDELTGQDEAVPMVNDIRYTTLDETVARYTGVVLLSRRTVELQVQRRWRGGPRTL